jgi:predicted transposase YbfD/YdcC
MGLTFNAQSGINPLLVVAFCAMLCGANEWIDMESYVQGNLDFLRQYFPYINGAPSDDTFCRVISVLDPALFQQKFTLWMQNIVPNLNWLIVAIDGKVSCGSRKIVDGKEKAVHMVSAVATKNGLVLSQEKVDDKSNEITAIPELIESLDLRGATVTIDAMGCQHKIAEAIVAKGGQYVLALKGNQEALHDDVVRAVQDPHMMESADVYETQDFEHGRHETRRCFVMNDVVWLCEMHPKWQTIQAIVAVESWREIDGKMSRETRCYVSSKQLSAKQALETVRSHWAIENKVHWVLDVAFDEDHSKIRARNGAQNLAIMRHMALNLLRNFKENNPKFKRTSIRSLRKKAGWDTRLLKQILDQDFS